MRFLVDTKTRRPGCVNIQAAFGNNQDPKTRDFFLKTFNAEDWLVGINETMRQVEGTEEQWLSLAAELERRRHGTTAEKT